MILNGDQVRYQVAAAVPAVATVLDDHPLAFAPTAEALSIRAQLVRQLMATRTVIPGA